MAASSVLSPAVDRRLGRRFTLSAETLDSPVMPNALFHTWFEEQRRMNRFEVNRIPFAELVNWGFQEETGNLVHDSGKFFAVEGLRVQTFWDGASSSWSQPILNQPEVGILGIVVKEFDGILHCLMQAKMEPGNLETVQLSPTVQATRSNYTGVHRGSSVNYLEYFAPPRSSEVLVDSLQSEQGSWFLRKRNRNMVVEAIGDVRPHEDFCWLTIGQINQLLKEDNLVNMDARTVLSCIPYLDESEEPHRSTGQIVSWLTEVRALREVLQRSVPLRSVDRWERTADEIRHEAGRHFTIIAADVRAANREVTRWTQPLLAPVEQGLAAFVTRRIEGTLHLLVQARTEAGALDVAELAPTVQCLPGAVRELPPGRRPWFFDFVTGIAPSRIRYDSVQSEEGGRFFHADNRYLIVEVGDDFPVEVPKEFCWMTPGQLNELLQHSNYVNIQARTLLAGLYSGQ